MKLKCLFSLAALVLSGFAAKPIHAAEILPLAGEWRFALDRSDVGTNEQWFAKNLPDKIKLPGILQAQGYGDDISTNTPWVLTLGDAWWKIQPASLRDHFSQPGHVEVPFLSQPPKHYLGAAWYQRDIEIPDKLAGPPFHAFSGTRALAKHGLGGRQGISRKRQPRRAAHHRPRRADAGQASPDHPRGQPPAITGSRTFG